MPVDSLAFVLALGCIISMDFDAELVRHLDQADSLGGLRGFGANSGKGHLNERGHMIYAAALYDMLAAAQIPVSTEAQR